MRIWRVGRPLRLAVLLTAMVCAAAYAQAPWGFREGRFAPRFAPPAMPDGNFTFCRVMYERVRNEPMGMGWVTDYPYAEINLMTRLSELTRTTVSRDERGQPNHWVVRLTDPALFNCPFAMASDAGTIGLTPEERENLRRYLLKGGSLWVDDFWGSAAWEHWAAEIGRVLPPSEYPITDATGGRSRSAHAAHHRARTADHQHPVLALGRRQFDVRERQRQPGTRTFASFATAVGGS